MSRTSLRGRLPLKLAGVDYTLAPEFEALDAIEVRLDLGGFDLLRRFAARDFRFRDVHAVLLETSRAGGKPIPGTELGRFVLEERLASSSAAAEIFSRFFPAPDDGQERAPNPPAAAAS